LEDGIEVLQKESGAHFSDKSKGMNRVFSRNKNPNWKKNAMMSNQYQSSHSHYCIWFLFYKLCILFFLLFFYFFNKYLYCIIIVSF